MALHRAQDRLLPTLNGNVMTSGGSLNLAKGQLGIFEVKKRTANGLPAVSDFAGMAKHERLQLRIGKNENGIARTQSNKNNESRTFKLGEVTGLEVHAPNSKKIVDEFLIGYNGVAGSELDFSDVAVGDTEKLDIKLSHGIIGLLDYPDACTYLSLNFEKEREDQTNQEIVEQAVKRLKRTVLKEMVPVTEAIEINPINSESPASVPNAVEHTIYNLQVTDAGDSNALAQIQAQYDFKVERSDRNGLVSTYSVLLPTIASSGVPTAFSQSVASVIKGCEDCPSGFTAEDGGFIYYVSVEDDGEDATEDLDGTTSGLDGIPHLITDAVVKQGQDGGKGIYAVATDTQLTPAEIATFVDESPTAEISYVAKTEDICNNSSTSTIAWTAGVVGNATTQEFTLTLSDDDCGNNKLAAVEAQYPELSISAGSSVACQTTYTTTATSGVIFEECDEIFRDLFETESPAAFGYTEWEEADPTYDANALMGIKVKGKETNNIPSEVLRDGVPFINTSVRISVAGGQRSNNFLGFSEGSGDRFAVKVLSRAEELENLGGTLWALEDRDFTYFNGYERHRNADGHQNEYIKFLLGEESVFQADKQYVLYKLKVQPTSHSQGLSDQLTESFNYMISAPVGEHQAVEDLLNSLAAANGLPTVQAYGNS